MIDLRSLLGPERAHALAAAPGRVARALLGRLRLSRPPRVPRLVNWDLTYACPLRCEHCYSESGRRASRQLPTEKLLAIADVLGSLRPIPEVVFTGGEPLVVKDVLLVAGRLRAHGARLALYTSGYGLREGMAQELVRSFDRIAVSIDGDTPAVNDRIRGRPGAYDVAVAALHALDRAATARPLRLGIECTVVRSNVAHLEGLCALAFWIPRLSFLHFGAAIPTGLASEAAYADRELLDDPGLLRALAPRLHALAPPHVTVRVYDNAGFLMRGDQIARGLATDDLVKIEADGRMRAMDIYEGTVGNVLEEPFADLWERACARHRDPFVADALSRVGSMSEWARATRAIDRRYAGPDDLVRLRARSAS